MADDLREPAPAWLTAEHVDSDEISRRLADTFEAEDPTLFLELLGGELAWSLAGFDGEGWGHVTVVRKATGEEVGGAECHWSSIVRAA